MIVGPLLARFGKAAIPKYSRWKVGHGNENIIINLSDSYSFSLKAVKGEITPFWNNLF